MPRSTSPPVRPSCARVRFPYGAITEVYLTFMTDPGALKGTAPQGQASAPKERSYAEEIMFRAKPYIQIPQGVHGEYSVELTLRINETGGIEQMSVSKSSGKAEVDNAVLTGVIREGVIPPPGGFRTSDHASPLYPQKQLI